MTLRCPHCGEPVLLALAAIQPESQPEELRPNARQSSHSGAESSGDAIASRPPPGSRGNGKRPPPRGADGFAPLCEDCGTEPVGRRRNGGWFRTCYRCG